MKEHFIPYLDAYDLANLNQRAFYCKTLIRGQVKEPFSLKTPYIPDVDIDQELIRELYDITRSQYARPLKEVKKIIEAEQKDVIEKIEDFVEPLI